LRDDPTSTELLNSLALNWIQRRHFSQGERLLRAALEVDPDAVPVVNNLVAALLSRGKVHEALAVGEPFVEARTGQPNLSLLRNLGKAYLRAGQYGRAERTYWEVERVFRATGWPREKQLTQPYVCCLCYLTGEYDRSAAAALEWAAIQPANENGRIWAASAYRRAADDKAARRLLRGAAFRDEYFTLLARALCGEGAEDELYRRFPERGAETDSCLGEYWFPVDPGRALEYWRACVGRTAGQTFAELRAVRNLADNTPPP
jgi:tetratricopeptide (TPR) repeat protein